MRLKDKVAIVTGGSSGIGYAVCEAYLKEGAKVAIGGITEKDAKDAMNSILANNKSINKNNILAVKLDVTLAKDIKSVINRVKTKWKKIDVLVNNAGICTTKSILQMTEKDYNKVMNVNATGTFRCINEVAKYMIKTGGSIINTSSLVSLYGGAYQTAYATSKFAINGITKSCAKELGQYNIRVNAVAPGVIETDMVKDNVTPEMKERLKMMTPLKRVGTPKDLTGLYIYLASDESTFTTGDIISVDGGIVM